MATIKPRRGTTYPASGLSENELAVDTTNRRIYLGSAGGSGITVASHITDYVVSLNGSTGAITNVAFTNAAQTFTQGQTFNSAIPNTVDVISDANGIGLRVGSSGQGRIGGIRLGRSSTTGFNSFIYQQDGTFYIYPGATATSGAVAVFQGTTSDIILRNNNARVQITAPVLPSNAASIRMWTGDDDSTPYYCDIVAPVPIFENITQTLPSTTGTLLNTTSAYVSSVNGLTGAVTAVSSVNGATGAISVPAGAFTRILLSTNGGSQSSDTDLYATGTADTLTINAGAGILLTGNSAGDAFTITNQAANTFLSMVFTATGGAVEGIPLIQADLSQDTLTVQSGTGTKIVVDSSGDAYSIFNTGVLSFNGSTGAVQGVSSVNGATGAVQVVSSFNGLTGAVQGVSSVNGATGAVQVVSSFNGSTGAVVGVSSVNGLTGAVKVGRSVSVYAPTTTDNITMFYTSNALTLSNIESVIRGAGTGVTFSVRYGTDRSATGTEVVTSGINCTNTTTGLSTTSFNNGTISASSFVWLTIAGVSGNPNELSVTLEF